MYKPIKKENEVIEKEEEHIEDDLEEDKIKGELFSSNDLYFDAESKIFNLKGKLDFYYENKIPIKFRLIEPKNHWEIKGKIELVNEVSVILINNNFKLLIPFDDIDPLTILPSEFKQVVDNIRIPISPELREFIFKRDNYKCQLKLEGCTNLATEIDHKISVNDGGNNNPENLWASCLNCNRKKGKNSIC